MKAIVSVLIGAAAVMQGCASIVDGKMQSVSVRAMNKGHALSGAQCKLNNNKGEWYLGAPGTVSIQRSAEDLIVICEKAGHEPGHMNVESSTKAMAFGNILFGGLIGAAVDRSNGSAFDYPALITVQMGEYTTFKAQAASQPGDPAPAGATAEAAGAANPR